MINVLSGFTSPLSRFFFPLHAPFLIIILLLFMACFTPLERKLLLDIHDFFFSFFFSDFYAVLSLLKPLR